jgi:hypothetical protein
MQIFIGVFSFVRACARFLFSRLRGPVPSDLKL